MTCEPVTQSPSIFPETFLDQPALGHPDAQENPAQVPHPTAAAPEAEAPSPCTAM